MLILFLGFFPETSRLTSKDDVLIVPQPQYAVVHVPLSPHPYQHLMFIFLMMAILTGVRWDLKEVLICIYMPANEIEHFKMCLLAICIFGEISVYHF